MKVQLSPKLFGLEDLGNWIEADLLGSTGLVVLEPLLVGTMPKFHRSVVSLFRPHPGLVLMSFWLRHISHSQFRCLLYACIFSKPASCHWISLLFTAHPAALIISDFIINTKFIIYLNMQNYNTISSTSKEEAFEQFSSYISPGAFSGYLCVLFCRLCKKILACGFGEALATMKSKSRLHKHILSQVFSDLWILTN